MKKNTQRARAIKSESLVNQDQKTSYTRGKNIFSNKFYDLLKDRPLINRLEEQWNKYYFPDNLKTSYGSMYQRIQSIIEHLLFLFLVGFPKRLKDRQQYWKSVSSKYLGLETSQTSSTSLNTISNQNAFENALLKGGEAWQAIYLTNEQERTAFLQEKLKSHPLKDKNWQDLTSGVESSNYLWNALEDIKKEEQNRFKEQEKQLQEKEKALQHQLQIAEAEVDQKLSQRSITAFFLPVINALAQLLFKKEQIKNFEAQIKELTEAGKTVAMLRKIFTSWQGFIALFMMTLIIILTLDSTIRTNILVAIPTPSWVKDLKTLIQETTIPTGVQVFTAITAAVIALFPVLNALKNYATSVQNEQKRIQSEREYLLKQEQNNTEGLVKEVAQLRLQVEEKRKQVGLTANYATLMDFVSDRLQQEDYDKRLGLMQQVKQDLAALSDRLTDQTQNRKQLKKFFPRGPVRVVLYIDDLDRCPPNRVVEILEAVQLLLNTQLFIVILGIDDRYIARALEQVYRGVLKRGGKPSGIDYLEKIIQIPYRMRPISPEVVESYLRSQLKLRPPAPPTTTPEPQPPIASSEPATKEPMNASAEENITKNDSEDQSTEKNPVKTSLLFNPHYPLPLKITSLSHLKPHLLTIQTIT